MPTEKIEFFGDCNSDWDFLLIQDKDFALPGFEGLKLDKNENKKKIINYRARGS